ncbi:MAG: hypothetical protein GY943_01255 [Chloroflexi bacterium]|nr:hypothetical protein [Chloroflexota bacterium]
MKDKWIWIVIILLLVSCSPVVDEPELDDVDPSAAEGDSALNTAVPPIPEPEELPIESLPPNPEPIEDEGEPIVPELEPGDELQLADPVSVDLKDITPSADNGGELIIQPAPGVPGQPGQDLEIVQNAIVDLSQRLGIDETEISFSHMVEVQWPNSGLGCPQPGMSYLQVITNGSQIVLNVGDQAHYYHTSGLSKFIYCEDGKPVAPTEHTTPPMDE